MLKRQDFYFDLPAEQIAQFPLKERSESRLLVLARGVGLFHRTFKECVDYLNPGDVLVFNNSRVMKARLFGHKDSGGQVEVLIERVLNPREVLAHVRASKPLKEGRHIHIAPNASFEMLERVGELYRLAWISESSIFEGMNEYGHIPLPPYIDRSDQALDEDRYQTVYAKPVGSVAAPTAGLHFDEPLLAALDQKGIKKVEVTLHVGAGTFQPVRVENIEEHSMHSEWLEVPPAVCDAVRQAKAEGNRVIAVGTTSARALEAASHSGSLEPFSGETKIFIYPGYEFKTVDGLITNFHLPESTLLMLVSALAGVDPIKTAYQVAIQEGYRFFSYGDAMLIV